MVRIRGARRLTAICSMASLGWKLLGPSSHTYPLPSMLVMLPPTRSRASVTRKLLTPCLAASAWPATRPDRPPPTMTTSTTPLGEAAEPAAWAHTRTAARLLLRGLCCTQPCTGEGCAICRLSGAKAADGRCTAWATTVWARRCWPRAADCRACCFCSCILLKRVRLGGRASRGKADPAGETSAKGAAAARPGALLDAGASCRGVKGRARNGRGRNLPFPPARRRRAGQRLVGRARCGAAPVAVHSPRGSAAAPG